MPRLTINLEPFKDQIIHLIANGVSHDRIVVWLAAQDILIGKRTFERRVHEWGARSTQTESRRNADPEQIQQYIYDLFSTYHLKDDQIAETIHSQYGIYTTSTQVKDIRLQNNWSRQWRTQEQRDAGWEQVYHACWQAILYGPARSYGRTIMKAYLESELGIQARLDHVQEALKLINQDLNINRAPSAQAKRKHEAVFYGPDYVWSIDGHDKFTHFGIEIYGMIDCHSRKY